MQAQTGLLAGSTKLVTTVLNSFFKLQSLRKHEQVLAPKINDVNINSNKMGQESPLGTCSDI